MEYLSLTPGEIPTNQLHAFLVGAVAPRPIGFASTLSGEGIPNLAPFSFFNVFGSNPPTLIFSPARRVRDNTVKDTVRNAYAVPEVVINVVNHAMVNRMNLASAEYAPEVNEFEKAGLTPLPSETVRPFRVAESPVQFECRIMEIKPMGAHGGAANLIICRVTRLHVNREILNEKGGIDPQKIDLMGRMGGNFYVRANGGAVVEVDKPMNTAAVGVDALPLRIRHSPVLTGEQIARLANCAALPDAAAVAAFRAAHAGSWADTQALHAAAAGLLQKNEVEQALLLLLSQD